MVNPTQPSLCIFFLLVWPISLYCWFSLHVHMCDLAYRRHPQLPPSANLPNFLPSILPLQLHSSFQLLSIFWEGFASPRNSDANLRSARECLKTLVVYSRRIIFLAVGAARSVVFRLWCSVLKEALEAVSSGEQKSSEVGIKCAVLSCKCRCVRSLQQWVSDDCCKWTVQWRILFKQTSSGSQDTALIHFTQTTMYLAFLQGCKLTN